MMTLLIPTLNFENRNYLPRWLFFIIQHRERERETTYKPNTSCYMYHSLSYNNNDTLFRICTRVGMRRPEVCCLYLDNLAEGHCFPPLVSLSPTLVSNALAILMRRSTPAIHPHPHIIRFLVRSLRPVRAN
jgi:hypothetical protein